MVEVHLDGHAGHTHPAPGDPQIGRDLAEPRLRTEQGSVQGEPEALYVDHRDDGESICVAVSPAAILISTDGGTSFTTRYAG